MPEILLILTAVLILALAVFCFVLAYNAVYIRRLVVRDPLVCDSFISVANKGNKTVYRFTRPFSPETLIEREFIDQELWTRDGLCLAAWFIPSESDTALILLHGHKTNRSQCLHLIRHFGGDWSLLVPDLRGHGESQGNKVTYGYEEVRDIEACVLWLNEHGYKKIILLGLSMGGAVAISYASQNNGISGVITEGTYHDLLASIELGLCKSGLGWLPLSGMILRFMSWLGGFTLPRSPELDLKKTRCPVLVLQSENDEYTPQESGIRLESANPGNVKLVLMPYSRHTQLASEHPELYNEVVSKFVSSCFNDDIVGISPMATSGMMD
jgi:pimeloyl-ACP methyl ester carboxylesterase